MSIFFPAANDVFDSLEPKTKMKKGETVSLVSVYRYLTLLDQVPIDIDLVIDCMRDECFYNDCCLRSEFPSLLETVDHRSRLAHDLYWEFRSLKSPSKPGISSAAAHMLFQTYRGDTYDAGEFDDWVLNRGSDSKAMVMESELLTILTKSG